MPREAGKLESLIAYEKWLKSEGLEVIKGYSVDDVRTLALKPWHRKGGMGVFINLEGAEDWDDAYVCEIAPASSLKPQKHLFEEEIFILSGRGRTEVWNEGGPKRRIQWQEGSVFAIPLNAWHQHFNEQEAQPARYLAVTDAPLVMNIFHNMDFVFNNSFIFNDRYDGQENYFSGEGKLYRGKLGEFWDSNFIADINRLELAEAKVRGAGGAMIKLELANNSMYGHVSEYPVGTYKKAHRHNPAAHLIILSGKGYSLLWKDSLMWSKAQLKVRVDWHAGSMLVPHSHFFHQHFNTGREPARYLVFQWGTTNLKFLTGRLCGWWESWESTRLGGDQIEYEDEDPEVRRLYEEELRKEGLQIKMPPISQGG